jgi:hypothetical protein
MPLSDPAERNLLHLRDIQLRGYQRKDGLFDIEAHLVDTKSYGFNNEGRGWIEPGEALHGMWIRMTINEDSHPMMSARRRHPISRASLASRSGLALSAR